jgi:RND family efflux transporter MFP subunit
MRSILILVLCAAPVLAAPPEVRVISPVEREVFDSEVVHGRTAASVSVEIRARVTGHLDQVLFKDGSTVKRGDALFQIDDRLQRAEFARAQAELARAEASLKRVELDYARMMKLLPQKVISQEEVDKATVTLDEAKAQLQVVRASLETAKLNLNYTRIASPIDGRIGRTHVDAGNLVRDGDRLATVMAVDKLHVEFSVDEAIGLRLIRYMQTRKDRQLAVHCQLGDDAGFPRQAVTDFVDPSIDPKNGTLRVRAMLPNPKDEMRPGQFVRVRVPLGDPRKALLLPDAASHFGRRRDRVLVVNDKNILEEKKVAFGNRYDDNLEIESGLKLNDRVVLPNDRVVTPGVPIGPQGPDESGQNLKAGDEVKPRPIEPKPAKDAKRD